MVVGARKLLTSALGLALVGSLLGGLPATAAGGDDSASGSIGPLVAYTNYDIALAPNAAPAGAPVQVHGYVGDQGPRNPRVGVSVTVYFDPVGTLTRRAVATVSTDDEGWFATTVQPRMSGTYEVVAADGGQVEGINKAKFTLRPTSQTIRSGVTSASKDGYTAKMRVIAQDVVTRVEPQTVYVDSGILTPGSWVDEYVVPALYNRRGEGQYPAGLFWGTPESLYWSTNYSGVGSFGMSALHPAGLYDVYYYGEISVERDRWDGGGFSTWIKMPQEPITTIRVRRASTTTIAASSTSFTGARNLELHGSVRKVQLVHSREAANLLAPNTALRLYFDPAGPAGPVYTKTVHTNSRGAYRTSVMTSRSGTWIAKYVGTSLQAPSKGSVTVTVR
jgi:hypothetical protein